MTLWSFNAISINRSKTFSSARSWKGFFFNSYRKREKLKNKIMKRKTETAVFIRKKAIAKPSHDVFLFSFFIISLVRKTCTPYESRINLHILLTVRCVLSGDRWVYLGWQRLRLNLTRFSFFTASTKLTSKFQQRKKNLRFMCFAKLFWQSQVREGKNENLSMALVKVTTKYYLIRTLKWR